MRTCDNVELFAAAAADDVDDVSVGRIGPDVRFSELNTKKKSKRGAENCVWWMLRTPPARVVDFTNQIIITT